MHPDIVRPTIGIYLDVVRATVVAAIDHRIADTGGAYLAQGDFLLVDAPLSAQTLHRTSYALILFSKPTTATCDTKLNTTPTLRCLISAFPSR